MHSIGALGYTILGLLGFLELVYRARHASHVSLIGNETNVHTSIKYSAVKRTLKQCKLESILLQWSPCIKHTKSHVRCAELLAIRCTVVQSHPQKASLTVNAGC